LARSGRAERDPDQPDDVQVDQVEPGREGVDGDNLQFGREDHDEDHHDGDKLEVLSKGWSAIFYILLAFPRLGH